MKKALDGIAFLIATFFGVGKIPFAPGTFGSIAGLVLAVVLFVTIDNFTEANYYMVFFGVILVLFFSGVWASSRHARNIGKVDPSEIVIDEVMGMIFTIILSLPMIIVMNIYTIVKPNPGIFESNMHDNFIVFMVILENFVLPFALFRFFDICKPLGIKKIEQKLGGGVGIMMDDFVAAMYACIAYMIIGGGIIGLLYR